MKEFMLVFLNFFFVQSSFRWNHRLVCFLSCFREKSIAVDRDDLIQVKEAFKWIMQGLVAKELGGVAVVTRVGDRNEEEKKIFKLI